MSGLKFAPGDVSSLVAKLRQLVDNPGLLARLREGIRPVKSVAEEMTELLEIYGSVAGNANRQGQVRRSQ